MISGVGKVLGYDGHSRLGHSVCLFLTVVVFVAVKASSSNELHQDSTGGV